MRVTLPGVSEPLRTMRIRLAGEEVECLEGETLAAALLASGHLACRTTASGESRGLFCGMGVCQECVMAVDGAPARACMTAVRDGMEVEPLPAGGLLARSPSPSGTVAPLAEIEPELLVVGGGPGGLSAAAAAAESGVQVVLLDERSRPGGQYFKQPARPVVDERVLDRQYREGRALLRRVAGAEVHMLGGVQVWGATSAAELFALGPDGALVLRPRRLVIAPGAYERGVPLPGWTLPGFMTTGAAQTLMRAYQVLPGQRVLVSGNGPLNLQVAAELVRAGAEVAAVCEAARIRSPRRAGAALAMGIAAPDLVLTGAGYLRTLRRAGVPVLAAHAVVRAEGKGRVERAMVAALDQEGRAVSGSERSFEVDAVCVGFGFLPSNELARSLGAEHRYDAELGQLVTVRDGAGRTSIDGVWVVGDGGGVGGARLAKAMGTLAGLDVAQTLGHPLTGPLAGARRTGERDGSRNRRFQRAMNRLYRAPRLIDQLAAPDTLVCRCEAVSMEAIDRGFSSGISSLGALKRVTRAGMGRCQGRYCAPVLAELAHRRSGRAIEETDWFAPAPPFKPLPVKLLAGATPPPAGGPARRD